ncbi:MAG: penicillin-binding transpeptidase domain-containing protein [Lachnospirales bacterium]
MDKPRKTQNNGKVNNSKGVNRKPTPLSADEQIERDLRLKEIKAKRRRNRLNAKIYILSFVFFLMVFFLCYKVGNISLNEEVREDYKKRATVQQTSNLDSVLASKRGSIVDKNGDVLAISNRVYDVILDITNFFTYSFTSDAKKQEAIDKNVSVLSSLLGLEPEEISKYYEVDSTTKVPLYNDYMYLKIASKVSYDTYLQLEEANLLSVYTIENTNRNYPKDSIGAHIVGFLNGNNSTDNYGLENSYNSYLTGIDGRKFNTINQNGEIYNRQNDDVSGSKLVTTIDSNLQEMTEKVAHTYGESNLAQNAAAIIMKVQTGEILAMGQYPNFNNNYPGHYSYFNKSTFESEYENLIANGEDGKAFEELMSVWQNFAISYTFEPGSTYKASVVAAAIEEKIITANDVFVCNGGIDVADYHIKCWNEYGHGTLDTMGVLENSCNVGMIKIAQRLGANKFYEYQRDFGFGSLTGIDLPGEVDASSDDLMYSLEELNETELATSSMGQGFNSTALQSLVAFNAVINGGNILKPYIVSEVINEDGEVVFKNEPTVLRKTISEETSDYLRIGLEGVVETGTGGNAKIEGYSIGGKTATGEQGNREGDDRTVSFIGYLPVDNPEYIVMTILHLPQTKITGGGEAALMAHEVMEELIEYYSIAPDKDVNSNETVTSSNQVAMPNLVGLEVEAAILQLVSLGLDFQIADSGYIVSSTFPEANTVISRDSKVVVNLESMLPEETEEDSEDVTTLDEGVSESESMNMVQVPNIVGESLDTAIDTLEFIGLSPLVYIYNGQNQIPLGTTEVVEVEGISSTVNIDLSSYVVSMQSSKAGVLTPVGTTVKIIVEKK